MRRLGLYHLYLFALLLLLVPGSFQDVNAAAEDVSEATDEATTEAVDDDDAEPLVLESDEPPKPRGPPLTDTTWVVAATTPLIKNTGGNLFQPGPHASPYVHYTCFRQTPTTEKLPCCQHIYHLLVSEQALVWSEHAQLGPFLRYCVEVLATVPVRDEPGLSFQPQFTLVLAPTSVKIPAGTLWRQKVAYSSTSHAEGQWHYSVESPLQLAIDPLTFYDQVQDDEAVVDDDEKRRNTFAANLTTTMGAGDDGHVRRLQHVISVESNGINNNVDWSLTLTALAFVPEGVSLRLLSDSCAASCTRHCHVSLPETASSTEHQEALPLTISLSRAKKMKGVDTPCTVTFRTELVMDDEDEDFLLAAPVLYEGRLHVGTVVYHWKEQPPLEGPLHSDPDRNPSWNDEL